MRSNRIHVLRCASRRVDDYVGQGRHLLISLAHSHSRGSFSLDLGIYQRSLGEAERIVRSDVTCARERDHLLSAENFRNRRGRREEKRKRERRKARFFFLRLDSRSYPRNRARKSRRGFFLSSSLRETRREEASTADDAFLCLLEGRKVFLFSGSIFRTNVSFGKEGNASGDREAREMYSPARDRFSCIHETIIACSLVSFLQSTGFRL